MKTWLCCVVARELNTDAQNVILENFLAKCLNNLNQNIAQFGSAFAREAKGRWFKSNYSDQSLGVVIGN